ncbi:hypothetical protein E4634_07375 [Mangrovimicrobium sediminis]|uniref:IPTL-CTERM sorting domain-containing protein n=1 Tax=Mangrovimicrobium sediminis TaxID=2562682 RepID=A0A4Z0M3S5_9GAMM|nr:hypothetical protein [Haliea sp. SAOS-164]TGD73955.1 hypothetical protein E4634_07375 [Haliea sp. SAOS-164]
MKTALLIGALQVSPVLVAAETPAPVVAEVATQQAAQGRWVDQPITGSIAEALGVPPAASVTSGAEELVGVPLSAAAWLFGLGLFGFVVLSNRRSI